MKIPMLQQAVRNLARDWRGGELTILTLAVVLAVTAVSAVSFFTDRLKQGLEHQASDLLAADLVISSSEPVENKYASRAGQLGLETARLMTFPSVVLAGTRTRLVNIKAVSHRYPLRGHLRTTTTPYGKGVKTNTVPPRGEAWIESRLFSILKIKPGDIVQVGELKLKATRALTYEPDRGSEFFNIAPRLMMNHADIPASKLIQRGSRVKYRLLIAGPTSVVNGFRKSIRYQLKRNQQIFSLREARPELRSAIERGESFLSLATLVSLLLAGVAIAITARRYAVSHLDHCAIYRCLGATQRYVNQLYIVQLSLLGILASAVGVLLGWGAQQFLAWYFRDMIQYNLPAPGWSPVFSGLLLGMLTLYLFALPLILRLGKTPPLRVIRRDIEPPSAGRLTLYGSMITALTLFLFWQIGDLTMALRLITATVATLLGLALIAWLLIQLVHILRRRAGTAWRFGITNAVRHSTTTSVQIIGFGLGIMALLLLSIVRNDLLDQWQTSLPPKAPNQFVINIQNDQLNTIRKFFHQNGYDKLKFYPMIRGRLIRINKRDVGPDDYPGARAKRLITREFNLSWAALPQSGNQVIAGKWWKTGIKKPQNQNQFSVEQGIAKTLGIKLGDRLTYVIAGREYQAVVTSLRKVNWDTMRPNFFVLGMPGSLDDYPATWIGSFYLPETKNSFLTKLVQQFPNLTIFDVQSLIKQVRVIMDKVVLGIEYVFLFTLIAGALVLFAAIEASQQSRLREGAIVRALGGRRSLLLKSYFAEFAVIGMLAGLLAAIGATVCAWFITQGLLNIEFQFRPMWWLVGMVGGGLGVGLAGLVGTLPLIRKPPVQTIRQL